MGQGLGYERLLPDAERMQPGGGVEVWVLNLEKYIGLKEELGGEKDLAVLPTLRRTLAERQRLAPG